MISSDLGILGFRLKYCRLLRGNQVVQIPQSRLVLGEEDDMPGMAVANFIFGPQGRHGRVDGLESMKAHFLQLATQPVENQATGEASSAARWWLNSGKLRALATMSSLNFPSWGSRFWERIRVSRYVGP